MLVTIEGIYKDGKIDLTESPKGVNRAKVIVTFLPEDVEGTQGAGRMLQLGQFSGPNMSAEEDFKIAEWRGPTER